MENVFKEIVETDATTESYLEQDYTAEEFETAEKDFFSLDEEVDKITTNMILTTRNAEAFDYLTDDSTVENHQAVIVSIQALTLANGMEKDKLTGNVDFTTESKDKDSKSMTDKAKGFAKKLWAKVKVLIAKAKLFVTKWVAKAMVVFVKGDGVRKKLATNIKGKNLSKISIPEGWMSKALGKIMDSQKGQSSSSMAKSLLTFSSKTYVTLKDTAKLKELTGYELPTDAKISMITTLSGGRYLVETEDKDGNPILKVVPIKSESLSKYRKAKTLDEFGIDLTRVITQLNMGKKDIHDEIAGVLEDIKEESEVKEDATPQELSRVSSNINAGVVAIRGVLSKATDATTVAGVIVGKSTSGGKESAEDLMEKKDDESINKLMKMSIDPKTDIDTIEKIVKHLKKEGKENRDEYGVELKDVVKRDKRRLKVLRDEFGETRTDKEEEEVYTRMKTVVKDIKAFGYPKGLMSGLNEYMNKVLKENEPNSFKETKVKDKMKDNKEKVDKTLKDFKDPKVKTVEI